MKRILFLPFCLLFLLAVKIEANAQKLVIRLNSGAENIQALNTIQKLYFSGNEMVVDFKSGSDDNYFLSDIRKIYFDSAVGVGEMPSSDDRSLRIYPNPAGDVITLAGIPQIKGLLSIYRMDGGLVMSMMIAGDQETIDVSGLPQGLYVVNVPGFITKFVKQ